MIQDKQNILITAPSSIIGHNIIHRALRDNTLFNVYAAQRNFISKENVMYRTLDFHLPFTFKDALKNIEVVFLTIPENFSTFKKKNYELFLEACKLVGVKKVVMLSVHKANTLWFMPLQQVEKLLTSSGLNYSIVRSTMFMQNILKFYQEDILSERKINIPNFNAKINWIDAQDVAKVLLKTIHDHSFLLNKSVEVTGLENRDFVEVTAKLSASTNQDYQYKIGLPKYIKKLPILDRMIFTILSLYHLVVGAPKPTNTFERLTGRQPRRLNEFIMRNLPVLMPSGKSIY
ncbi:NmrA family NAD(P)-binding protein [Flammeovirga pacifica]|uniref:NmrA-like domain-containing protein n=1 Tax=Flammeovirga pacifica TaxID=915059 RepID=A0A1S1Z3Y8_FLAPC|nr:NmrA family NAD(P)-binding protein [Flammeovirga pacifica]OHX67942.1 hypothetical protein NH26_17140 [Flammeovirga pacifica]